MDVATLSLEQTAQPIECQNCARTHSAGIGEVVVARGAAARLPEVLARYVESPLLIVGDENTMRSLGDDAANTLGAAGFAVSKFSFGESAGRPVCNHEFAGKLIVSVPEGTRLLVGVGGATVCGLVKYAAKALSLPCVILPTAASGDSFAMPYANFIENGAKLRLPAALPECILADVDVMCRAPRELTTAGLAAAISKYIALFDWRLSAAIDGTFYCEGVAGFLRGYIDAVCKHIQNGRAVDSPEAVEALARCLLASGVATNLAASEFVARGSESAVADALELGFLADGAAPNYSILQGLAGAYCARMIDSLKQSSPDFSLARELLDNFGWVSYNQEVSRVFGARAEHILARARGGGLLGRDDHRRRIDALEQNWPALLNMMVDSVPPFSELRALYRASGFLASFADYGIDREESLDALIWGALLADRYGLLPLLWDLGLIDAVAVVLTKDAQ